MMSKIPNTIIRIFYTVAVAMLLTNVLVAQAVRIDQPILTNGPNVPSTGGPLPQALFVANATVTLCTHTSSNTIANCLATPITTYTDSTLGTSCPTTAQLVQLPGNTCTSSAGTAANVGFWYSGGQVDYVVASTYGTYGPYTITSGGSSGSVQVNSVAIAAPNFNSSTPAADSGNTAVTWKCNNSGSGPLCIAEVPSISAAQAAPRTSTGLAVFITGTSIDCVDGNGVSLSPYCYAGNRTDLNNTGGAYDWPSLFVNMDFIKGRATSYCNYATAGASIYGSSSGLTYWYSNGGNPPTTCTINGTGYSSEHLAAAAAGSKCYALVGGLPNDTPGLTNATQLAALEAALSNLWYLHHNDGCYVVGMTTAARNSSNQTAITGIAATTSVLTVYTAGALPAVGSAVSVFGLTNTAYDSVGTTYTVASVGSGNFTVAGTFTAISYTADTTGNFILRTQESDATRYWRDQFNDWVRSKEATGCTSSTACGPDKLFDLARFMQNQPLDVVWSYDGTHPNNAMNYKIAQALNNILWGNGNIYPPVNGPGLVLGDNNGNVISPQTAAPLLNGGIYNTVYGEGAGLDLIAQSNVTLTGFDAGGIAIASGISAYGSYACYQTSAQNDCYGVQAGLNTTTGANNFFAGYYAGFANTTGGNNTYVGDEAGFQAVQLNNTCVGFSACGDVGTSNYVTAIGSYAAASGQAGVVIGYNASVTGTGGVAVGASARATAAGAVQLAQGTNSTANALQYQSVVIADSSGNLYDAALGVAPSTPLCTTTGGELTGCVGYTGGSAAAAGKVGEVISSAIAVGSAVSLTTATPANVTSISLTAGDWDVSGNCNFTAASATTALGSVWAAGISTTSATLPTDGTEAPVFVPLITATSFKTHGTVSVKQVNVSSTTTVYLVCEATFTAGTAGGYGDIRARRVR